MSKFSLDVLQRRVFPFVQTGDPDVILGAAFGEDVALTRIGEDILVSHVDPIVGAIGEICWLAVHVACNDVAAAGVAPRWLLLLILVPRPEDEELLERIMRDANRAAQEVGASIIGGHTGYSAGLSRPLVAVTALGTASGREPVRTGGARVGDHVLVTKGIALEGTAILAQDFGDVARGLGLREEELEEGSRLRDAGCHRPAEAGGGGDRGPGGVGHTVCLCRSRHRWGWRVRSQRWDHHSLCRDSVQRGRVGPHVGPLPSGWAKARFDSSFRWGLSETASIRVNSQRRCRP